MARSLQELEDQIDEAIAAVPALLIKNTEGAALDALALADLRISETGIDAKGAAFVDYTPDYKKAKTKKGRYTGYVNFMDTGQMLASTATGFERIAPTERSISNGKVRIVFDGRDQLTRDKLKGNNKKRPGFLNPSASEIETVTESANDNMRFDLEQIFK